MWSKIKEDFDANEKKYERKANYALGFGVATLILAPSLISQLSIGFDFTETGQIGDTIGGITTPVLTLIGALLVYYSFKQQMAANKIQISALMEEKQSKNDMQIVEFCDRIQKEVIEKIKTQKVNAHHTTISNNTRTFPDKFGVDAITNTLEALDRLHDNVSIGPVYKSCLDGITIIFRNVNLLLKYIDKIENDTIQEMLFNSYYNNLHLFLFIDIIEIYFLRKSHGPNERKLIKLCIASEEIFKKLDEKYKVQNKWLTMQYQN
ncbi:hypothetical protein [Labilibaculum sp.]|uniref:hypothetical protein n=1 Tax=Labilibaculum sp. TaxID=2060723 RepID=UPI002AA6ABC9|nr:hypothetical protein [Labilibaculum sp.]